MERWRWLFSVVGLERGDSFGSLTVEGKDARHSAKE